MKWVISNDTWYMCNNVASIIKNVTSNYFLKLPLEISFFSNYQYQYIIILYSTGLLRLERYSITLYRFKPGHLNVSTISPVMFKQLSLSIIVISSSWDQFNVRLWYLTSKCSSRISSRLRFMHFMDLVLGVQVLDYQNLWRSFWKSPENWTSCNSEFALTKSK